MDTYHEALRRQATDSYSYQLLPDEPTVELQAPDFSNLTALRPVVVLRNFSAQPLRYAVESMAATLGGRTVAHPNLPNRGGIVGPNDVVTCPYDVIVPVKADPTIAGSLEYAVTYGPPDGRPLFRSHRRYSITMHRLSGARYQLESKVEEGSDTRIPGRSLLDRLRRSDR